MSSISWKATGSGNWNTAADWSGGVVPGAGDDVTINTSNVLTVTYSTGSSLIQSLTTGGNDTFAVTGGTLSVSGDTSLSGAFSQTAGLLSLGGEGSTFYGAVTQKGGTLRAASGTLVLNGTDSFAGTLAGATIDFSGGTDNLAAGAVVNAAALELTGATLSLAESLSSTGRFEQTAGTLLLGDNTLAIAGTAALDGGVVEGGGTLSLAGQTELSGFALEGQASIVNTGTIVQTGYSYLGYNGTDTARLANHAGAIYRLDGDVTIYASVDSTLTNAGLLIKSAGAGSSQINASVASTGTVSAAHGTLLFDGGQNSFAGLIAGGGTVAFGAGADNFSTGLSVTAGHLLLEGATLSLAGPLSTASAFDETSGTLALGGNTLTLSTAVLDGGEVSGTGTIALTGTGEAGSYYVTGSTVLDNTGTLTQNNYLYIGYNGADTAKLVNAAGATFKINGSNTVYGQTDDLFTNVGTLLKNGGSGTSQIQVSTTSTGSIGISAGTLDFTGPANQFSGSIGGAGTLELDAATTTFGQGLSLRVAQTDLAAGDLTLGGALSYAGELDQTGGTISLGGNTLTLTGASSLDGGSTNGSGTVDATSTEISDYALTGSTVLADTGTVTQTGYIYVGYNSGDTAKLDVMSKTSYLIEGDVTIYGTAGSSVVNAGTIIKENGSGTAQIEVNLASTGTITVNAGALLLSGAANTLGGAVSGAGTLALNSGADAFKSGLKLTASHLLLEGAGVTLGGATAYAGMLDQTAGTLALGGYTLTLTGADAFDGGGVGGSGTLAAKSAEFSSYAVTGNAVLSDTGTITQAGYLYIGYNNGDMAQLRIAATAAYVIEGDNIIYGTSGSSLTNAGALTKADGSGAAQVDVSVASTGTISVDSGTLYLSGASNSLSGTIQGGGALALNTGADSLAAGVTLTMDRLLLDGATVTLGGALSYAGALSLTAGTLALGGNTLSLSQSAVFEGGSVTGAGTISLAAGEFSGTQFSGSVVLDNSGVVDVVGYTYIGYANSDTNQLHNLSGATLNLDGSATIYGVSGALITNAGTIDKTGSATSDINDSLTTTGSIVIDAGGLALQGGTNSIGGTVSGGGALILDSGADSLAAGLSITTGSLSLSGATVTVAHAQTYAGAFMQNAGVLNIAAANLQLGGPADLAGGSVTGNGTLTLGGASAISNTALVGSVIVTNTGTINATGYFYVGYNSSDSAQLDNAAGGLIHLENGANIYTAGTSELSNAGSIVETGAATITINAATLNSGTIEVAGGGITFAGKVSGTGSFTVDAGSHLAFTGSASGGQVTLGSDTDLYLNVTAGFTDTIHGFAAGDVIELGGLAYASPDSDNTFSFNATTDVLSVFDGGSTSAKLQLAGNYTSASFHLFDDNGIIGITHT